MTILKRKEQERKESNLKKHQGYVHTILDSFVTAQGSTNHLHTSNIVPAQLAKRVWGTKLQFSLQNIYFHLRGFQFSLLLIYFCDGLNRCSRCTKVQHKIYAICDAPFQDWCSAPLFHHRNHAATTIPVCEQKLYPVCFSWQRKTFQYSVNITSSTQCFSSDLV